MSKKDISRFLDENGKLKVWPSKQSDKETAVEYLAGKFDIDKNYHEHEVNEILKLWHTFSDWPLLRRELYERGYFSRNKSGEVYIRLK